MSDIITSDWRPYKLTVDVLAAMLEGMHTLKKHEFYASYNTNIDNSSSSLAAFSIGNLAEKSGGLVWVFTVYTHDFSLLLTHFLHHLKIAMQHNIIIVQMFCEISLKNQLFELLKPTLQENEYVLFDAIVYETSMQKSNNSNN